MNGVTSLGDFIVDFKKILKNLANPAKERRKCAERKADAYEKAWKTLRSILVSLESMPTKDEFKKLMTEIEINVICETPRLPPPPPDTTER